MKAFRIILIILLISAASFQCQISSDKKSLNSLPSDVIKTIENRIANGATPSIAIALIESAGTTFYNFGKTSKDGKAVDEYSSHLQYYLFG
ncbi:hypothetical protein SYJ56_04855 [Algoriphagus sp. D3-2-R+10]|uniref:hypothetical protein n=1 Tax=Algoriphagus aurantiacus TaxID=3103948 RepID=UPI002B38271D|nr:hypothetical protein [Algoriphagus sp. D3-2-R+10]MEB2774623.1 hypothetical protein [Algoriphagus sp. D3-2-R+10]